MIDMVYYVSEVRLRKKWTLASLRLNNNCKINVNRYSCVYSLLLGCLMQT